MKSFPEKTPYKAVRLIDQTDDSPVHSSEPRSQLREPVEHTTWWTPPNHQWEDTPYPAAWQKWWPLPTVEKNKSRCERQPWRFIRETSVINSLVSTDNMVNLVENSYL